AESFALTEYLTTLAGPRPKGEAARNFYARVAQITGLPEDTVARSRGFIRDAYVKHLRSAEGKIVCRYDATFAVADPYPEQEAARGFLFRVGIGDRKGRIVAADDLAFGGAQVLDIGVTNETARPGDRVLRQSGDLRHAGVEIACRLSLWPRSRESGQILREREAFRLRQRLLAECAFTLELGGGEGGQLQGGAQCEAAAAECEAALDQR